MQTLLFMVPGNLIMPHTPISIYHPNFPPTGQQVVEEMLDAQRAGCAPEYENIKVPKCHPLYDPDCRSDRVIPFLRSRYDFRTGYNPNNPRMQLNEITPWMDGGLVYGPFKAWTDAIRSFEHGELAALNQEMDISEQFPIRNSIGLPLANPPPPANNTQEPWPPLFPVNRFWGKRREKKGHVCLDAKCVMY